MENALPTSLQEMAMPVRFIIRWFGKLQRHLSDKICINPCTSFIKKAFIIVLGGTTCLVIDRNSYKQLISSKVQVPDYEKVPKKTSVDNEFKALRLRDLRIVATLGVGGE